MTTTDPTIHADRFTGPGRPPQIIDHEDTAWSVVPHGDPLPSEARQGGTYSGADTVRLTRANNFTQRYFARFTPLGAETLGQQLIDSAQEARANAGVDPADVEDYVTVGQLSATAQVESELAESITTPDEPEGTPWAVGQPTNANGGAAGLAEGATLIPVPPSTWTRIPVDHVAEVLHEYDNGIFLNVRPAAPSPMDAEREPVWSDPQVDSVQTPLGALMQMAEAFLIRQGQGQLVLAVSPTPSNSEPTEWMAGFTFGQEAPDSDMAGGAAYGMGETATDALRQALNDAGEKV